MLPYSDPSYEKENRFSFDMECEETHIKCEKKGDFSVCPKCYITPLCDGCTLCYKQHRESGHCQIAKQAQIAAYIGILARQLWNENFNLELNFLNLPIIDHPYIDENFQPLEEHRHPAKQKLLAARYSTMLSIPTEVLEKLFSSVGHDASPPDAVWLSLPGDKVGQPQLLAVFTFCRNQQRSPQASNCVSTCICSHRAQVGWMLVRCPNIIRCKPLAHDQLLLWLHRADWVCSVDCLCYFNYINYMKL